jgi:hypothetical protein
MEQSRESHLDAAILDAMHGAFEEIERVRTGEHAD